MQIKTRFPILANIIYGLLVLIPIAIIFLLIARLTIFVEKVATPLGFDKLIVAVLALVATIMLMLLVSLMAGIIVRAIISFENFKNIVLTRIPGYEIISNVVLTKKLPTSACISPVV